MYAKLYKFDFIIAHFCWLKYAKTALLRRRWVPRFFLALKICVFNANSRLLLDRAPCPGFFLRTTRSKPWWNCY